MQDISRGLKEGLSDALSLFASTDVHHAAVGRKAACGCVCSGIGGAFVVMFALSASLAQTT